MDLALLLNTVELISDDDSRAEGTWYDATIKIKVTGGAGMLRATIQLKDGVNDECYIRRNDMIKIKSILESLIRCDPTSRDQAGTCQVCLRVLQLLKVNTFSLDVSGNVTLIQSELPVTATLGVDKPSCAAVYVRILKNHRVTEPPLKTGKTIVTDGDKHDIMSLYLNALLIIVPSTIRTGIISKITVANTTDRLDIRCHAEPDFTANLALRELTMAAFFAATAVSKASGETTNITEWAKKRIPPLLISTDLVSIPESALPIMGFDVKVIGEVMKRSTLLREAVLSDILGANIEVLDSLEKGLFSQIAMVLEYTGMQSAKLAMAFGEACETLAHSIDAVVIQTEYLEERWHDTDPMFRFKWLLKGQDPEISMKKFPDLAYCALAAKQEGGETSWKHFVQNFGNVQLERSPGEYKALIKTPLKRTMTGAHSARVKAYLTKGRSLAESQSTDIRKIMEELFRMQQNNQQLPLNEMED